MAPRIEYQTREEWLQAAAREFASELFEAQGYTVPRIRVGVGFPSAGKRSNVIGECWTRAASGDDTHEIIIRIERTDPAPTEGQGVLDILLHEMCHAVAGLGAGHGTEFKRIAHSVGLAGPATATYASDETRDAFRQWVAFGSIGAYPMARFGIGGMVGGKPGPGDDGFKSSAPPKQSTRMLKAACDAHSYDETVDGVGCGYTVRLTRKWADVAIPKCPNPECERFGEPLTLEGRN